MRISMKAESLRERLGFALDMVPTPLGDVMLGPLLAQTVIAASALGIFDALADGPRMPAEVAARCGSDAAATARLLRALHGCKYLRYSGGRYALTRMSARWLPSGAAKSVHAGILHRKLDIRYMDFERYARTGAPRDFHAELDEDDWACYRAGQACQARLIVNEVLQRAPIPSGATRMLDLGGSHGVYAEAFCQRYPGLSARVLDLATPAQHNHASQRVRFEAADIRTVELGVGTADVVLTAHVIHHFDAAVNACLFERVARSLSPGGIMITLELCRSEPETKCEQIEALMDLYFGCASGGQLWTVSQIRDWQRRSGLHPLPAVSMRLLPGCKLQPARKPSAGGGL